MTREEFNETRSKYFKSLLPYRILYYLTWLLLVVMVFRIPPLSRSKDMTFGEIGSVVIPYALLVVVAHLIMLFIFTYKARKCGLVCDQCGYVFKTGVALNTSAEYGICTGCSKELFECDEVTKQQRAALFQAAQVNHKTGKDYLLMYFSPLVVMVILVAIKMIFGALNGFVVLLPVLVVFACLYWADSRNKKRAANAGLACPECNLCWNATNVLMQTVKTGRCRKCDAKLFDVKSFGEEEEDAAEKAAEDVEVDPVKKEYLDKISRCNTAMTPYVLSVLMCFGLALVLLIKYVKWRESDFDASFIYIVLSFAALSIIGYATDRIYSLKTKKYDMSCPECGHLFESYEAVKAFENTGMCPQCGRCVFDVESYSLSQKEAVNKFYALKNSRFSRLAEHLFLLLLHYCMFLFWSFWRFNDHRIWALQLLPVVIGVFIYLRLSHRQLKAAGLVCPDCGRCWRFSQTFLQMVQAGQCDKCKFHFFDEDVS